ncbi:MAG: Adenosylmethionine-8-amino-7-oxononanoate aminotransferase [Pseudomonadota bacterium]|jgi:adenosylmethionine-8-amino-7-oxononanoate aminotransferase
MFNHVDFHALSADALIQHDRTQLWHPYAASNSAQPLYAVARAEGCTLFLKDGRQLIDGMASWWAAIHGYNHPQLNAALSDQTQRMAHVMFGGLTHAPAVELAARLIHVAPKGLARVFLADSGSVAMEVAIKMAVQYWQGQGQPNKQRMICLRRGYHGDTLGAMSLSDPDTGMHSLFHAIVPQQIFAPAPTAAFACASDDNIKTDIRADITALETLMQQHHSSCAALVLEPIVQGAGGMRFYSAQYLKAAKALCERYQLLLIADEIATGFGRTGTLFACQHAGITPDILCVGKALTGGYLTLAASLCTQAVADGISQSAAGVFMHGPTFMANPLACAVANASLELLASGQWQTQVVSIETQLNEQLAPCRAFEGVADVRVLGAIGVIEFKQPLNLNQVQPFLVEQGVWLRPFGKLLYCMPPFIINPNELTTITRAMVRVAQHATEAGFK